MFTFNKSAFDTLTKIPQSGEALISLSAWAEYGGWLSKTDATEHVFGSSGRGDDLAGRWLNAWANAGLIERRTKGRSTWYRVPIELYEAAKTHPRFNPENHQFELNLIRNGDRPKPKGE